MTKEDIPSRSSTVTIFWSTLIGTAIEQYDFTIYGVIAATVFNKLFFPALDPLAGTLAAIGTYAAGVFARPLGGILAGHFGDRTGRKTMLLVSLTLMGIATTAIGLLPTYEEIGFWAPVILVLLRLVQGMALGAEQGGAILVAVENAPSHRRGLFGSFPTIGSYLGALMAFGTLAAVSTATGTNFAVWGWRIPFIASIALLFIGVAVRSRLRESPVFLAKEREPGNGIPLMRALRNTPRELLVATSMRFCDVGWSTIIMIVTATYAVTVLGLTRPVILKAITIAAAVALVTVPIIGWLSDRVGRRPPLIAAGVIMSVFAWPYFLLLQTRDPQWIVLAVVIGFAVITPLTFTVQGTFFSELFSTGTRYTGVSVSQQIGGLLSAGLIPFFATLALARTGGDPWPLVVLTVLMGAGIAIPAFLTKETLGTSLSDIRPSVVESPEPSRGLSSSIEGA